MSTAHAPRRPSRRAAAIICALLAAVFGAPGLGHAFEASAELPPPYRAVPAHEGGIGKLYDGREIAQVMGFSGASWLERTEREHDERPDQLIEELNLTPGTTVADIGAGSGYYSRRLAPLIAPAKLFAVDVQPQMVELLRALAQEPGLSNIVAVQGASDDVNLPHDSIDLAIMVDVYHELAFPYEVIRSLLRALKSNGRLVFVEYRGEDASVPIQTLHKMTERQVRREMGHFPLVWVRTSESLPIQHIIEFRKRALS